MDESAAHTDLTTAFLSDAEERCPVCRYNLRGVQSSQCPECGYRLRLTIAAPAGGFAWCLMSLIGLAITSWIVYRIVAPQIPKAIGVIDNPGLTRLVQQGFVPASDLPHWPRAIGGMGILLVCLASMALIIGLRRRLVRLPLRIQVPAALVLLFSPVLTLAAIAVTT